jgi:dihydroorotase
MCRCTVPEGQRQTTKGVFEMKRTLIRNARIIEEGNGLKGSDLLIDGDRIIEVREGIRAEEGMEVIDAGGKLLVPGFTDVHVHLREPGFEYKETIATGTRAAALGGYTTIYAMPNTSPCPDNEEVLLDILGRRDKDAVIGCEFYSTITKGEKGTSLVDFGKMKEAGAIGFTDDGKGVQDAGTMYLAMVEAKKHDAVIAAHCEDESILFGGYIHEGEYSKAHGHKGILSLSEDLQILRDSAIAAVTGARYHICHMSTEKGVEVLKREKENGTRISGEVTPHHLLLSESDLEEHGNFKMNPPLRGKSDREALVKGLRDGVIECIATDHAPHSAEDKSKGLEKSAFGIVGLETAFGLLYTGLVLTGEVSLETIVHALTKGPRRIFGLLGGGLEPGDQADLCLIDLEKEWTIDSRRFASKGRNTPFEGQEVKGFVDTVLYKGRTVVRGGILIGEDASS